MNESGDSRSVVAVVIICAMLLLVCVAVPVGLGAIFFVRVQQSTQAALAAQRDALAAEQRAIAAQAEAARQAAEQMRLANERMANAMKAIPPAATQPLSPAELPLESRKLIYQQLKQADAQIAAMEALAAEDPAVQEAVALAKAQRPAMMEQLMAALKMDRQQFDAIIAEGDKEKW